MKTTKDVKPKIKNTLLNVVIIVNVNMITQRQSRTVLFSSDLTLDALTLIDYYSLRFQIESDFRDANLKGEPPILRTL